MVESNNMMFEPTTIRRFYVNKVNLNPTIVINGPLAMDLPPKFLRILRHWIIIDLNTKE
jgi:hypothetical protein